MLWIGPNYDRSASIAEVLTLLDRSVKGVHVDVEYEPLHSLNADTKSRSGGSLVYANLQFGKFEHYLSAGRNTVDDPHVTPND